MPTKPKTEKSTWSTMTSLREAAPVSGFGYRPSAPVTPTKVRETLPLTSHGFAALMEALDNAGAHDLKYLKLSEYLNKTGKLLDIPMPRIPLGYSDKAECATDRVNFPVMGSIYETVASQDVQAFVQDLVALPSLSRDSDFQGAAERMLRAVGARTRVQEEYPGFGAAWNDFFEDQFASAIRGLPNLVTDPDRKLLFEALSSIVSGRVTTPELRPFEDTLNAATDRFNHGSTQEFADCLYALSAEMTTLPPPSPPEEPDEQEGSGEPEEPCNGGQGGSGEDADDEGDTGPEQDQQDQESQDSPGDGESPPEDEPGDQDSQGQGQPEDDAGKSGEDDPAPERDPFAQLAQYMRSQSPENQPDPQELGAAELLDAPEVEFDASALDELMEIEGDIVIPDTAPALQSLFMQTPVAPTASAYYSVFRRTYNPQIREAVRLVDEFYRIKTINERGLMSGRADGARLYKAQFGTRDVFKRAHVDSVGHMDMIVLVDESGSMGSNVDETTFRLPDRAVLDALSSDTSSRSSKALVNGEICAEFDADRATMARLVGAILNEASRNLEGFNVEVAGYSGVSREMLPEPMRPLYDATQELRKKDVAKAHGTPLGNTYISSYAPFVRMLATKSKPLPVMSSDGMGDNADLPALAWAIERLEKRSTADQRVIVFIADGFVNDSADIMPKLIERARKADIYIHFMDMSDGDLDDGSPLAKLPRDDVNDFKSMFKSLTRILDHVTSRYR